MFNDSTEYFCHHEAINQACDCYENIPDDVDNAADSLFWKE